MNCEKNANFISRLLQENTFKSTLFDILLMTNNLNFLEFIQIIIPLNYPFYLIFFLVFIIKVFLNIVFLIVLNN